MNNKNKVNKIKLKNIKRYLKNNLKKKKIYFKNLLNCLETKFSSSTLKKIFFSISLESKKKKNDKSKSSFLLCT